MKFFTLILIPGIAFLLNSTPTNAEPAAPESWGDLGYTHPASADVQVIPESAPEPVANAAVDTDAREVPSTAEATQVVKEEPSAPRAVTPADVNIASDLSSSSSSRSSSNSHSNISTVENTYGVMTEEKPPIQLFAAPFAGFTSSVGNTTVQTSPLYAAGATLGLLISGNIMINASFTHSEQGLSYPNLNAGFANTSVSTDVFRMKTNEFDAGARLFFLGRESKLRPFFGAGMGYGSVAINYDAFQPIGGMTSDYTINQFKGFGELGAEFAFTRAIVAMATFKLDGVLSNSSNADANTDQQKLIAGTSLSSTSTYTVGVGVGFYF